MPEDEQEERRIHDLLRSLDHHPREASADDVMRRARRPQVAALRIAAGLAAALGLAGIAYAMPGLPVRGWVRSVLDSTHPPAAQAVKAPPAPGDWSGAGMVFDPAEPMTIRVSSLNGGHLRISLSDGAEIVARLAAGEGRFTSEPNELRVRLLASDTLEVVVPRTAASVEVVSEGRRLFMKRGVVLRAEAEPDAGGRYRIDLGGGAP